MDTIPYHDEDLRQLFRQLPTEKPSEGFTKRVITHVSFEAQRADNLKRIHIIIWAVSIPCSIMLLLIAGFFTRQYWEIHLWKYFGLVFASISQTASSIADLFSGSGYRFVTVGLLFLTLLLGDLFFRRYMERKR
jgi:hypothetical protein